VPAMYLIGHDWQTMLVARKARSATSTAAS
jgi:hypothetical protein